MDKELRSLHEGAFQLKACQAYVLDFVDLENLIFPSSVDGRYIQGEKRQALRLLYQYVLLPLQQLFYRHLLGQDLLLL
jgi:hypothetical protein